MQYIMDTEGRFFQLAIIRAFFPCSPEKEHYHPVGELGEPDKSVCFSREEVLRALGLRQL